MPHSNDYFINGDDIIIGTQFSLEPTNELFVSLFISDIIKKFGNKFTIGELTEISNNSNLSKNSNLNKFFSLLYPTGVFRKLQTPGSPLPGQALQGSPEKLNLQSLKKSQSKIIEVKFNNNKESGLALIQINNEDKWIFIISDESNNICKYYMKKIRRNNKGNNNNNENLRELQKKVSSKQRPPTINLTRSNNLQILIPTLNNSLNNNETGSLIDFIRSIKNKKDYIIQSLEYIYNKFNDKPLILEKLKSIIKSFLETTNNKNINSITNLIKSNTNNTSLSEYELLLQQFKEIYETEINIKERITDILKYIYDKIKNNKKYIKQLYDLINLYERNGNLKSIEENFAEQKKLIEIYIDSRIQNNKNNEINEYKPIIKIFKSVYNQRIINSKEDYFEILLYIYDHIKDNKDSVNLLYKLIITLFDNSNNRIVNDQQKLNYIVKFIKEKLNEIKEYKNFNTFSITYGRLIQIFKAVYRIQYDTNNNKNYTNLKKRLIKSIIKPQNGKSLNKNQIEKENYNNLIEQLITSITTPQNRQPFKEGIYRHIGTLSQPINKEGFLDFTLIEYYIYDSNIHGILTDKNKLLEVSPFYYSNGLFHINPNQNSLWKKIRKYVIDIIDPNNKNSRNNSYYNNHKIMINNINLDDIMNNISSINNNNKKSSIEFEEKFIYNITFGSPEFIKNFYEMCKKYSFLFNTICLFKNKVLDTYTIDIVQKDKPILSKLNSSESNTILRNSLSSDSNYSNNALIGTKNLSIISSSNRHLTGSGKKLVQTGGLAVVDDILIGVAAIFVVSFVGAFFNCSYEFSLRRPEVIETYKSFYEFFAYKTLEYFVCTCFLFVVVAITCMQVTSGTYVSSPVSYGTGTNSGKRKLLTKINGIILQNDENDLISITIKQTNTTIRIKVTLPYEKVGINIEIINNAEKFIKNIFNIIIISPTNSLEQSLKSLSQELFTATDGFINNLKLYYSDLRSSPLVPLTGEKTNNTKTLIIEKYLLSKEFIAFKIYMMKLRNKLQYRSANISALMITYNRAPSMNGSIAIAL